MKVLLSIMSLISYVLLTNASFTRIRLISDCEIDVSNCCPDNSVNLFNGQENSFEKDSIEEIFDFNNENNCFDFSSKIISF